MNFQSHFQNNLQQGKAAESDIAYWLRGRGWAILPVYEKLLDEHKGPQFFTPQLPIVAPDMLVFKDKTVRWVEAKHKEGFSWYGKGQAFVTGIDVRHYEEYQSVCKHSGLEMFLFFLHRGGTAKYSGHGEPPQESSPSGLFIGRLCDMVSNEDHRSDRVGSCGMVYWRREEDGGPLKKIAEYDEVINAKFQKETK